ncbi:MAG: hypothetical protein KAQ62_15750 [Cyclobacteriaceae bacterium]|nr:hypothetical protein [Cyclobacteriaceae bacterium]MCK5370015.1 hypothetical protein [Cyclobacteriaceae bacterium]MCK5471275.1 hypothetical protein [Cyclobacteriaceae bacterium]MCK5702137.1 hypothetical protein [Cyclobacteriaceae bacterium]
MQFRLIILLILVTCSYSFAQSANNKPAKEKNKKEIDRGATYEVGSSKVKKKKVKYSISKDFDKKIEEYEKRMEDNAKKNQKIAKEMKKPQYSDPTYFGHKKKPKKRPPGKKKFCKECGMYH